MGEPSEVCAGVSLAALGWAVCARSSSPGGATITSESASQCQYIGAMAASVRAAASAGAETQRTTGRNGTHS